MSISIVIPTYNAGNRIKKCIQAIQKKVYKDIEILVIDDGSEDVDAKICDECEHVWENVIVKHVEHKGVSVARNIGLSLCKGKYISFVDVDDYLDIEKLFVLKKICEDREADVIIAAYKECLSNGKILPRYNYKFDKEEIILYNESILKNFLMGKYINWNIWGKLYKRDAIIDCKFPEGKRTAEDMFFIFEVCKKVKKVIVRNEMLYSYVKGPGSTMASRECAKFFDTYNLIKRVCCELHMKDVSLRNEISYFYYTNSLWIMKFIVGRNYEHVYDDDICKMRQEIVENIFNLSLKSIHLRSKLELFMLRKFVHIYNIYCYLYAKKIYTLNA